MKKRLFRLGTLVILCVALCLVIGNAAYAKTTLRIQIVYPEKSWAANSMKFFTERVKAYTAGDVEFQIFWPGQLVGMKESFSALQRGQIDALGAAAYNFSGIVPEVSGEQLPYAWANSAEAAELYLKYGYLDILREALKKHGVYYAVPIAFGTNGLATQFPINKIEDIKGKKIRTGGMQGEMVKAWGGAPVSLAGTEQYIALQRGTVNGTFYPYYTIQTYKYDDVISDVMFPAVFSPTVSSGVMLNGKVWDALSPENKAAFEHAAYETTYRSMLYALIADLRAYDFFREKGIKMNQMAPQEVERMRQAVMPLYEEHAKKSDLCAKQVEVIKQFLKDKGR